MARFSSSAKNLAVTLDSSFLHPVSEALASTLALPSKNPQSCCCYSDPNIWLLRLHPISILLTCLLSSSFFSGTQSQSLPWPKIPPQINNKTQAPLVWQTLCNLAPACFVLIPWDVTPTPNFYLDRPQFIQVELSHTSVPSVSLFSASPSPGSPPREKELHSLPFHTFLADFPLPAEMQRSALCPLALILAHHPSLDCKRLNLGFLSIERYASCHRSIPESAVE